MSTTVENHVREHPSDMAKKDRGASLITPQQLGRLLKEKREKIPMTANELALKVGLKRSSIYAYESGQAWPSFTTIVELARVLRIKPNEIPGLDDLDVLDRDYPAAAAFDVSDDWEAKCAFAVQLSIGALSLSESQRRAFSELLLPLMREKLGDDDAAKALALFGVIGRALAPLMRRINLQPDDVQLSNDEFMGEMADILEWLQPELERLGF